MSTAFFVMGLEKASALWREHAGEFDAVLVTDGGEIYVTEGLEGALHADAPRLDENDVLPALRGDGIALLPGEIYVTEGLEGALQLMNSYQDAEIRVIGRD